MDGSNETFPKSILDPETEPFDAAEVQFTPSVDDSRTASAGRPLVMSAIGESILLALTFEVLIPRLRLTPRETMLNSSDNSLPTPSTTLRENFAISLSVFSALVSFMMDFIRLLRSMKEKVLDSNML